MCGIFWPNRHVFYKTMYIYAYSILYMEYLYLSNYSSVHLSFHLPTHTHHSYINIVFKIFLVVSLQSFIYLYLAILCGFF